MSLARLWRDQGKVQQARELLGSGLRLVHRGVRHARSEGGEGAARRTVVMSVGTMATSEFGPKLPTRIVCYFVAIGGKQT